MNYVAVPTETTLFNEFGIMSMRRRIRACVDEVRALVTEGAVHGVYKIVTWPSFGVTQ